MSYGRRQLDELVNDDDSAWPLVQDWVSGARRDVELLEPSGSAGECLVSIQVTTRSPLGAVVFHTGGILVDHGWLRVLGSGNERLPCALPQWNFACGLDASESAPPWLLVADDVVGGFFALDGGRFSSEGHTIWYLAPDTVEWEDLELGYSDFLSWCFRGDVDGFYEPQRWQGWEAEVADLDGNQGLSVSPPLFTKGPPIKERSRRSVPIQELFALHVGTL